MISRAGVRLAKRGASRRATVDRSLPFVSMDWFFPRFPELSADKFRWMMRYLQGSFVAGAAFVFLVYHTPYAGADYDHEWQSPLYKWTLDRLKASGHYEQNLKVKRTSFYAEEETQ